MLSFPHNVNRISIGVDQPYEQFCQRYESGAPAFSQERIAAMVRNHVTWEGVIATEPCWR